MNENQLTFVKEYENFKPRFHKVASKNDNCIGGCHSKNFHTFGYQ